MLLNLSALHFLVSSACSKTLPIRLAQTLKTSSFRLALVELIPQLTAYTRRRAPTDPFQRQVSPKFVDLCRAD